MALDLATITPAAIKAKNVATEDYVDSAVASVDVSGDILSNNEQLARQMGYSSYAALVAAANAGTTIINGGYLNTGLIAAEAITGDAIQANTLYANRLAPVANHTTTWTGGGMVSGNFNGNAYGAIGTPTQGFRLSSDAAGTSADPNIYGAYIKGSTLEASSFSVSSAIQGNTGAGVILDAIGSTTTASSSVTNFTTLIGAATGSGFSFYRLCKYNHNVVITAQGDCFNAIVTVTIQRSIDNGSTWSNLTNGTFDNHVSLQYHDTVSSSTDVMYRVVASRVYGSTLAVSGTLLTSNI